MVFICCAWQLKYCIWFLKRLHWPNKNFVGVILANEYVGMNKKYLHDIRSCWYFISFQTSVTFNT